jgi:hypothetical protein
MKVMSTGPHRFKQNDLARAIRAANAAGLKVRAVKLVGGDVTLVTTDEPPAADEPKNPWDTVLKNDDPGKRPS